MWIVAPIAKRRAPYGTLLLVGSYAVEQVEAVLRTGERCVGAHVPDDHELAATIRQRVPRIPGLRLVEDADVTTQPPAPVRPEPPSEAVARLARALANGWTAEDLAGTWDGTASSETGNRSPISGLSLVEMSQAVCPGDWAKIRPTGRAPWSSSQWRPPVAGWEPPVWTRAIEVVPDVTVVDPPMGADEAPTVVFDSVHEDDPTTLSEEPVAVALPAPEYPQESVEQARAVLLTLYTEFSKTPSLGKANARLSKLGLPRIPDSNTLTWLLQQP